MNKNEFLRELRQALEGELNNNYVEQNIKFYDEYLSAKGSEMEESIIEELGDPRLIAKSIIDASVSSRTDGQKNNYSSNIQEDEEQEEQKINYKSLFPLKWYQKALIIGALIFLAFILIFIGRIVLTFVFTIGLPLLIIIFIITLLKNRR